MAYGDMLALILGGGRGARLWPLTKLRAKPAVPIAGKYRLIDIPVSNCLNSGINQIAILTQFNSVSLHRHITRTYHFGMFSRAWVQILAAEQRYSGTDWYQGTADSVRKQTIEIKATGAEHVLILAGDHLYRMDYGELADRHLETGADITMAVKPISSADTPRFGVLKHNSDGHITQFLEKPESEELLVDFASSHRTDLPYLGSMGIYLFRTEILLELLDSDHDDFGFDVIPAAIQSHRVFGYPFEGYWQDIGTMRSFYDANLDLTHPNPPFSFNDPLGPIYTRPRFLPGSCFRDVKLDQALVSDGCIVQSAEILNSILGIRSVIGKQVTLENTFIMGADYYETSGNSATPERPGLGIGNGTQIRGAIIDKNTRIGANVIIEPFPRGTDLDAADWAVRDGIVVVPKDATIPDGTRIAPGD